jgi:YD repeat-containing protein
VSSQLEHSLSKCAVQSRNSGVRTRGNRLTRTLDTGSGPTTEVYTYDAADKLLNVKVNGIVVKSFTYDLAGRTTGITDAGGTTTFSYDYEDRVTSITRPGMTTNAFAYNGFGARVSKTKPSGLEAWRPW